jgi:hypothetical protein
MGSIYINDVTCGIEEEIKWGDGQFYYPPKQTGAIQSWPRYGDWIFMTRRNQPRLIPATGESVVNAMLEVARKNQQETQGADAARPQNIYQTFMKGREDRIRAYREMRDQLAKTDKATADRKYAEALASEDKMEKDMAAMAERQSASGNQQVDAAQARAAKRVRDLEAQLNSPLKSRPAFVRITPEGGQLVPEGTEGARAVMVLNPNFFDRSIPGWEAQSVCVSISEGPRSQAHRLYPLIQAVWNSLDWAAIAKNLK